ncbi:MAG TPA: hypothetical protein VI248_28080 [Kineosporiaceae bacterium]
MASSSALPTNVSGVGDRERGLLFWTAVSTAAMAATALAIGITTLPRSGPNCRSACIGYPYTGGAEFAPRDYWWMYPASLVALQTIALLMILPRRDSAAAALAARISVGLAVIAAGTLVTDYGIQVAVVQPALIKGETDGIGLLSQYNPHGVFIALENVGYLLLGLAFAAAAMAADPRSRPERVARGVFGVGGALTVVALIGYALAYRSDIEYRFEVAGLAIDWLVLIITGILLGVGSRKRPDTVPIGTC